MKRLFKKLIVTCLIVITATLTACSKDFNLDEYISELRLSIYEGESQNFKVVAYAEKRETPFTADGFVGEMQNAVILKVTFLNGSPNDVNAKLSYGNENYQASLTYNPVSEKSTATICVENLPSSSSVNLEITSGEITEKLTLSSVIFDKTVTYNEALKSVVNGDKETYKRLFEDKQNKVEIHVRLIHGEGKNYYYIGFIEEGGKTTAYLVDGESATLLAVRKI